MNEELTPQKERYLREVEQKLLHTLELLFFGIRECRVILQRKLASIFDYGKLFVREKALAFHKTGADGKVLLCRFIVFHEIMPCVNALPVKVPELLPVK